MWNIGGESDPGLPDRAEVRPPALPAAAVRLLARRRRHASRRHDAAAAGDGFPADPKARAIGDAVHVRAGVPGQPGDDLQRAQPVRLSADRRRSGTTSGRAQPMAGGQRISAPAPYDTLPVHVRAGSIVPVGPELQYTGEKAGRSDHAVRLRRRRRRASRSTKTTARPTATRRAPARSFRSPGTTRRASRDRRAHRIVSRDARVAHVQGRARLGVLAGWDCSRSCQRRRPSPTLACRSRWTSERSDDPRGARVRRRFGRDGVEGRLDVVDGHSRRPGRLPVERAEARDGGQ